MWRYRIVMALAAAAAAGCAGPLAVTRTAPARAGGAVWGQAIEVPGLGALNTGGFTQVSSVSCASAGNCAAVGSYRDRSGHDHAFVASQRNGRWGTAIEVPGTGALNHRVDARAISVTCASAGNCTAGGFYFDGSGHSQAFVASQRNGRWGSAIEVPGTGALNAGGTAEVSSVSCALTGNCTVGGLYKDHHKRFQAFVASQRNGRWGKAIEVPGTGALNAGGEARVVSMSCASAGNCAVGGSYRDRSGALQAFVASQRNGSWGKAIEVPGLGALNNGGEAAVSSLSCASAGNCTAGGFYGLFQAFVASQQNGRWGKAIEVPGTAALNASGYAQVLSVSCAAAGNCVAGGFYRDGFKHIQAFVATQRNGRWGTAIEVPGTATLNHRGYANVTSVSCASVGNCGAGGFFTDRSAQQAFVASQRSGRWGTAIEVPGTGALNAGGQAQVISVSCAPVGYCTAGGFYWDGSKHRQGFVVSRS